MSNLGRALVRLSDRRLRRKLVLVTFVLLVGISAIDFALGFEVSLLVFYCVPLVLAVTALGWRFGVVTAIASVAAWLIGDFAAGAHYTHLSVLFWNAFVAIGTYLIVIWLFSSMLRLQQEMELRVQQRTLALTHEIAQRERLEKIVLEISERERRAIGHDLHDGLGQHLTGTAFAAQVLGEKLQEKGLPEQADAWKLVNLIDGGIEKTRLLAKGLLLAEIQHEGLIAALQELAKDTTQQFGVACELHVAGDVLLAEDGVATQIFRIAQEAVRNAIRHAKPRRIQVELTSDETMVELVVKDDGVGYSPDRSSGSGLGLSIMAHRAQIIGATFTIERMSIGGTAVTCLLSFNSPRHEHDSD